VEFREKTISGEFFINFIENQGYPLTKVMKFRPTFGNFILGPYCVEKKSRKYFHLLFVLKMVAAPFKIVFDEDLYVVFDEDLYVILMYFYFALSMS